MYLACDLYFQYIPIDVHIECFSFKTCLLCFIFNLITLDEHEWKYYDSGSFFLVGRFMQYISHLITKMLRMFKLNNNNWTMLTEID